MQEHEPKGDEPDERRAPAVSCCCAYLRRMAISAAPAAAPARPAASTVAINGLITFVGMLVLSLFEYGVFESWLERSDLAMLIGSQGASAVLVFDAYKSPLARPPNVVFGPHPLPDAATSFTCLSRWHDMFMSGSCAGNMVGAAVGVTVKLFVDWVDMAWLGPSIAVALAIMLMDITGTVSCRPVPHPSARAGSELAAAMCSYTHLVAQAR